jgi:hypothetical protein
MQAASPDPEPDAASTVPEGEDHAYRDAVNAPLRPETIAALNARFASGGLLPTRTLKRITRTTPDNPPTSNDAADNPEPLTLDRATATMLRDTLNTLLGGPGPVVDEPPIHTWAAQVISGHRDHAALHTTAPDGTNTELRIDWDDARLLRDRLTGLLATWDPERDAAVDDGLREQYAAAIDQLHDTRGIYAIDDAERYRVADAVLAVRDRHLEQLVAEIATADRIRAEVQVDRDQLAAKLARVQAVSDEWGEPYHCGWLSASVLVRQLRAALDGKAGR